VTDVDHPFNRPAHPSWKDTPMTPLVNAVIRDARPDDHPAAAHALVEAFHDGAVVRWAEPDPAARTPQLLPYFAGLLAHAAVHGTIRLAETDRTLAGVALWFPHPLSDAVTDVHDIGDHDDHPITEAAQRLALLEKTLQERHPATAHQYLAYLGVTPDRQNHGLGSQLLHDRLSALAQASTPAYLEANDPRNRRLYLRHGFTDLGPAVTVDGCPPVFPMWWSAHHDAHHR
jgi:GNAT superfamily N-acetyltransferase